MDDMQREIDAKGKNISAIYRGDCDFWPWSIIQTYGDKLGG